MTLLDPSNPERFRTLAFPTERSPTHVYKFFDDPDFIQLHLGEKKEFDIRWASNANTIQSLQLLAEIIEQADFEEGTIALRHTFGHSGTIAGGANLLRGDAEDVMNEVRDSSDRTIGYSLSNAAFELHFGPSWPKTFHNIETNEVVLRMKRADKMSRYTIDQAISLTAMEGLRRSTDETLDEFAVYLPSLRR